MGQRAGLGRVYGSNCRTGEKPVSTVLAISRKSEPACRQPEAQGVRCRIVWLGKQNSNHRPLGSSPSHTVVVTWSAERERGEIWCPGVTALLLGDTMNRILPSFRFTVSLQPRRNARPLALLFLTFSPRFCLPLRPQRAFM